MSVRTMTHTLPPQHFSHAAAAPAPASATYGGSVQPKYAPSASPGHPSAAQAAAQSSQKASDLLGAIYSPQDYKAADKGCHWTYETPNEEAHKVHSMLLTNVIRPWIHRHVKVPLLRIFKREKEGKLPPPPALDKLDLGVARTIKRDVVDSVLSKLPKTGESFDEMWLKEGKEHAKNISRANFSDESLYLARSLQKTDGIDSKQSMATLFMDSDSLATAIACEALRHPVVKERAEELGREMDAAVRSMREKVARLQLLADENPGVRKDVNKFFARMSAESTEAVRRTRR